MISSSRLARKIEEKNDWVNKIYRMEETVLPTQIFVGRRLENERQMPFSS